MPWEIPRRRSLSYWKYILTIHTYISFPWRINKLIQKYYQYVLPYLRQVSYILMYGQRQAMLIRSLVKQLCFRTFLSTWLVNAVTGALLLVMYNLIWWIFLFLSFQYIIFLSCFVKSWIYLHFSLFYSLCLYVVRWRPSLSLNGFITWLN